jgi:uncharacterized membrane protein YcaP (DUF421 family)
MDGIGHLFAIHTSPWELIVRGSVIYWFLLLVFRFILRRDPGALGIADLLFVVIVADASQNGMSGSYDTVSEAFLLVGTLVAWNYALDCAGSRWKVIRRLNEPAPLLLVDRGRIVAKNMRKEFLTREELESELRHAGIDDLAKVRKAYMEGDGRFSVLTYRDDPRPDPDDGRAPGIDG